MATAKVQTPDCYVAFIVSDGPPRAPTEQEANVLQKHLHKAAVRLMEKQHGSSFKSLTLDLMECQLEARQPEARFNLLVPLQAVATFDDDKVPPPSGWQVFQTLSYCTSAHTLFGLRDTGVLLFQTISSMTIRLFPAAAAPALSPLPPPIGSTAVPAAAGSSSSDKETTVQFDFFVALVVLYLDQPPEAADMTVLHAFVQDSFTACLKRALREFDVVHVTVQPAASKPAFGKGLPAPRFNLQCPYTATVTLKPTAPPMHPSQIWTSLLQDCNLSQFLQELRQLQAHVPLGLWNQRCAEVTLGRSTGAAPKPVATSPPPSPTRAEKGTVVVPKKKKKKKSQQRRRSSVSHTTKPSTRLSPPSSPSSLPSVLDGAKPPALEPLDASPARKSVPALEPLDSSEPPALEPLDSSQPPALEPLDSQPPALEPLDSSQPPALEPLDSSQPPALEPLDASETPALEPLDAAPAQQKQPRTKESSGPPAAVWKPSTTKTKTTTSVWNHTDSPLDDGVPKLIQISDEDASLLTVEDSDYSSSASSPAQQQHPQQQQQQVPIHVSNLFVAWKVPQKPAPQDYRKVAAVTRTFFHQQLQTAFDDKSVEVDVGTRLCLFDSQKPSPDYNVYVEWDVTARFGTAAKAQVVPSANAVLRALVDARYADLLQQVRGISDSCFRQATAIYAEQVNHG